MKWYKLHYLLLTIVYMNVSFISEQTELYHTDITNIPQAFHWNKTDKVSSWLWTWRFSHTDPTLWRWQHTRHQPRANSSSTLHTLHTLCILHTLCTHSHLALCTHSALTLYELYTHSLLSLLTLSTLHTLRNWNVSIQLGLSCFFEASVRFPGKYSKLCFYALK